MSNLRICQAVSLNPIASSKEAILVSSPRTCLMGCQDVKSNELRRFPVHDENRCKDWLRHFGISAKLVDRLGGLQKLRICSRHFSLRQTMAKTRIKMTPLRKSSSSKGINGGGIAVGAGGVGAAGGGTTKSVVDSTTIELVESPTSALEKPHQAKKALISSLLTLPPRSHSICSSASSDVLSINSDYEASLPLSTLEDTQNGKNRLENGQHKKRKLYLITEKSDETNGHTPEANGQPKKRKMFVVVEHEKESAGKKLMIVADKSQTNLTQHLEKLLPEILNRIQDKEQKQIKPTPVVCKSKPVVTNAATIRPHITLPPKKNPTNFVKLSQNPSPVPSPIQTALPTDTNTKKSLKTEKLEKEVKEEEVAINSEEMISKILPKLEQLPEPHKQKVNSDDTETETNINLSPDFRFLMKILPKLEQLPEPHKQNVKRSIQIFVEKSYSIYGKKD